MENLERRACDLGMLLACGFLANTYSWNIPGIPRNPKAAKELDEVACEGGYDHSCLRLADRYRSGREVPVDAKQAARYLDKACRAGSEIACKEQNEGAPGAMDVAALFTTIRSDAGMDRCLITVPTGLYGFLAFNFTVDAKGRVGRLEILENPVSRKLARCIENRLRSLSYPLPIGGPVHVRYFLILTGGALVHETPILFRHVSPYGLRGLSTPNPDVERFMPLRSTITSKSGVVKVTFCVDPFGEVVHAHVRNGFPDAPQIDQLVLETVKTWRFLPMTYNGEPIKVCTTYTFQISF